MFWCELVHVGKGLGLSLTFAPCGSPGHTRGTHVILRHNAIHNLFWPHAHRTGSWRAPKVLGTSWWWRPASRTASLTPSTAPSSVETSTHMRLFFVTLCEKGHPAKTTSTASREPARQTSQTSSFPVCVHESRPFPTSHAFVRHLASSPETQCPAIEHSRSRNRSKRRHSPKS